MEEYIIMMQEDVCIVLNERESLKKNMAEALETKLAKDNITSKRVTIDQNIERVILEQGSKIFVFDYLLGNYTTGLDILFKLSAKYKESSMPAVIFLTDEPSIQAAVSAIQLGAKDYIQIDTPQALERTLNVISNCLVRDKKIDIREQKIEFIGECPAFQTLSSQIKVLSASSKPIIVIEGSLGCGKETVANLILRNKQTNTLIKTYDLRFFEDNFESLIDSSNPLVLGDNLSVIATNCSDEHDELLKLINKKASLIWKNDKAVLSICTSSHNTARAWLNLTPSDYIHIPDLNERRDDIPILCQHYVTKFGQLQHNQNLNLKLSSEFCNKDWYGGIDELQSVVSYCYLKNSNEQSIKKDIEDGKLFWEASYRASQPSDYLDRQTAYKTLEESNFHYRIAAAKLGCSIQSIKSVLAQEANT